jgi:CDGSH-type Zn-finger protein
MSQTKTRITVTANGPYLVSGSVPLAKQHIVTNAKGESLDWREGHRYPSEAKYALCRCGSSKNKPFCDGSHETIGFDGTETASREPQAAQAQSFPGPKLKLLDAESLCASGRFCDTHGQIWNLIERTDDPAARKIVEGQAAHCPAGRLVLIDEATGQAVEPKLHPSIGLVEDTANQVSGPLWVRGGIPVVAADGTRYEIRNRVTLCRCGASQNKPFCDGSHVSIRFTDEEVAT